MAPSLVFDYSNDGMKRHVTKPILSIIHHVRKTNIKDTTKVAFVLNDRRYTTNSIKANKTRFEKLYRHCLFRGLTVGQTKGRSSRLYLVVAQCSIVQGMSLHYDDGTYKYMYSIGIVNCNKYLNHLRILQAVVDI